MTGTPMDRKQGTRFVLQEPRSAVLLRRVLLFLVAVHIPIWALSSYRAYVQIRDLRLHAAGPVLREGSEIRVDVVSSGRTLADVRLELVQGAHAETLGTLRVPSNWDAVYDFRSRRASLVVVIPAERLASFHAGAGLLRATARGRPQWLREPPPVVRELAVRLQGSGPQAQKPLVAQ